MYGAKFDRAIEIVLPMLKRHEGFRTNAYKDIVGVVTIGYGFTAAVIPGLKMGDTITRSKADALLKRFTIDNYAAPLWSAISVRNDPSFTPEMFASIISLAYNVGVNSIKRSTLLRKVNARDYKGAQAEFLKWNKAGGKVVSGLTKRRVDEANVFAVGITRAIAAVRAGVTSAARAIQAQPVKAAGIGVGTIALLGIAAYLFLAPKKSTALAQPA
jgi:lysozyme